MKTNKLFWALTALFTASALMISAGSFADPTEDPIKPPPRRPGGAEGLPIGSLISTAVLVTPKTQTEPAKIYVWGYRKNGHSGNYNWNGKNVGFEHNSANDRKNYPRFESVKDFNDPNHPLNEQTVTRIFTTAHTIFTMTEEGELWGWGDSLYGTAGCIGTGYETGLSSSPFADYGTAPNPYNTVNGSKQGPHYQARPCPSFSATHPNPEFRRKVTYVDGGEYNVIALTADKQVFTWGSSFFGQTVTASGVPTGHKGEPYNITRFFVDASGQPETVTLVGGAYEGQYAVSVDKNGKYSLWGWGRSFNQSLVSRGYDVYVNTPERLTQYDAYANKIVYVNGGYGWTAVLLEDGRVYGSGLKRHLGVGDGGAADGNYYFTPQLIMGGNSGYPRVKRLIVRYVGAVALPYEADLPDSEKDRVLYTWGITTGSAYQQVYGNYPTKHELAGKIKNVGATKEAVFYMTEDNALYGIGYGDQRVINLCDNNTISYDRIQNKYTEKNSMNWYRAPGKPGGYRIPYENWLDVTGRDYCDGNFTSGYYAGQSRSLVRQWTGYDDGRDGAVPSQRSVITCSNSGGC